MAIDENDIKRLDEIYVRKDDCEDNRAELQEILNKQGTEMAVVKTKMNTLIGILSAIGVPVLAIAIKLLFM